MYDIAIVGGGPAGLVAATLLSRADKQVALLFRDSATGDKVGESLPGSINTLLQTIGLKPLRAPSHKAITGTNSLWAGERLQQDFIVQAQGAGWRLDRRRFETELLQQAVESGAKHQQALLHNPSHDGHHWTLHTDEGKQLKARFIIDASGRRSLLARTFSVARIKHSPLVALWAIGRKEHERHTAQTLIESQLTGWWYAAYLPDHRPLAIFHTDAHFAATLRRNPKHWLEQLISTQLVSTYIEPKGFLGEKTTTGEARSIYLQQPYGENWAACGDAALSFDPLSSQGIFNAIASAEMLSKTLLQKNQKAALRDYHQKLVAIAEIYQQRRREFYQRANSYHQNKFWADQLLEHDLD